MGKSKIKIQKIEKESNRRVTFNKRRIGLLRKAYEISILCDVDIALIFFSQSGEMTCFEGLQSSLEEVVMKFANLPEHERAKSHIQKYTSNEDQLRNAMPRKIENEEMFQAVARKLYESHPRLTSLSESNRATQMEHMHRVTTQKIIKEIKDMQRFIGLYDLNLPIGDLISSGEDLAQMEFYIRRQLQQLQNFKIMSSQIPAMGLNYQKDIWTYGQDQNFESMCVKQKWNKAHGNVKMENLMFNSMTYGQDQNFESICVKQKWDKARGNVKMENLMLNSLRSHCVGSTYMNQELAATIVDNNTQALRSHCVGSTYMNQELGAAIVDNNTQALVEWDTSGFDMGTLYDGGIIDQFALTLPELSESNSDFFSSSIDDDIIDHEFFKDNGEPDFFQKDSGA